MSTEQDKAKQMVAMLYLNPNRMALAECCRLASRRLGALVRPAAARRWVRSWDQRVVRQARGA
jgi:hypothetical protein